MLTASRGPWTPLVYSPQVQQGVWPLIAPVFGLDLGVCTCLPDGICSLTSYRVPYVSSAMTFGALWNAGGYTSFLSHTPHGSWRARSSLYITSPSWRISPRPD